MRADPLPLESTRSSFLHSLRWADGARKLPAQRTAPPLCPFLKWGENPTVQHQKLPPAHQFKTKRQQSTAEFSTSVLFGFPDNNRIQHSWSGGEDVLSCKYGFVWKSALLLTGQGASVLVSNATTCFRNFFCYYPLIRVKWNPLLHLRGKAALTRPTAAMCFWKPLEDGDGESAELWQQCS